MPRLAARGLACRRGARRLFADVDVVLKPGEALWVRGQNGAGKTSLLRLVAGLAVPEHGEILLDGLPVRGAASLSQRLLYIAHANGLKDDLTVAESLGFLLRIHGRDCGPAAIDTALGAWDMQRLRQAPVGILSQGQRRRVALARLGGEKAASLWVLDEPFDALDSDAAARLAALLALHRSRGGSILLTGHHGVAAAMPALRELDLDRFAG